MNGYDGSIMGAVNAMDQWHDFFDVPDDGGSRLGLIMAIYNGGNVCGSFFAGFITDKLGRRMGMLTGSVFILVGSILQATSQQLPQFIGGRFLVGFGVPISVTAAPTYLVEMAYPSWRGIAGGLYNVLGWYIGSLSESARPSSFRSLDNISDSCVLDVLRHWKHPKQLVVEDPLYYPACSCQLCHPPSLPDS